LKKLNGEIIEISGGQAARVFERTLKEYGDEGVWYLGEFAVGTNPLALTTGACQEDKHALGTLHFSPGGGALNKSKLHLDGVIIKPTLTIDGKVVIDNGVAKFL
jgi:leucyl aminopeptidase (aminopeptidase T)